MRLATLFALLLALTAFGIAACNTVEGVGRDVEAGGNALENTAKDAKDQ